MQQRVQKYNELTTLEPQVSWCWDVVMVVFIVICGIRHIMYMLMACAGLLLLPGEVGVIFSDCLWALNAAR